MDYSLRPRMLHDPPFLASLFEPESVFHVYIVQCAKHFHTLWPGPVKTHTNQKRFSIAILPTGSPSAYNFNTVYLSIVAPSLDIHNFYIPDILSI